MPMGDKNYLPLHPQLAPLELRVFVLRSPIHLSPQPWLWMSINVGGVGDLTVRVMTKLHGQPKGCVDCAVEFLRPSPGHRQQFSKSRINPRAPNSRFDVRSPYSNIIKNR